MFLRRHRKHADGEIYEYWSLVKTVRTARGPRHQLVARLGTNRTTLGARFQARFGQSPLAWLRAERMRHAAHLLAGSELSVAEVAAAVGYEDSNNFATAFRRHHGIAPRVFRKHCSAQRN